MLAGWAWGWLPAPWPPFLMGSALFIALSCPCLGTGQAGLGAVTFPLAAGHAQLEALEMQHSLLCPA